MMYTSSSWACTSVYFIIRSASCFIIAMIKLPSLGNFGSLQKKGLFRFCFFSHESRKQIPFYVSFFWSSEAMLNATALIFHVTYVITVVYRCSIIKTVLKIKK